MKQQWNMDEISDGKRYCSKDLVHIGCDGCRGNADCCRLTADTIILDPYDMYELQAATGYTFEKIYGAYLGLRAVDGVILPFLAKNENTGACAFLNADGRCSIHKHRPGFCRLFPLGRIYEGDSFSYFLQVHECPCTVTPKTEVSKWLEIKNLKTYEEYISKWHGLLSKEQETARALLSEEGREQAAGEISMRILKTFFITPYDTSSDFYAQFEARSAGMK